MQEVQPPLLWNVIVPGIICSWNKVANYPKVVGVRFLWDFTSLIIRKEITLKNWSRDWTIVKFGPKWCRLSQLWYCFLSLIFPTVCLIFCIYFFWRHCFELFFKKYIFIGNYANELLFGYLPCCSQTYSLFQVFPPFR